MGVNHIILTNAAKVQADYFGSHLLRPPQKNMREALKSGLEQAGDVSLPKVPCAIVLYLLCVIRALLTARASCALLTALTCVLYLLGLPPALLSLLASCFTYLTFVRA
jgi:hypothetical protein